VGGWGHPRVSDTHSCRVRVRSSIVPPTPQAEVMNRSDEALKGSFVSLPLSPPRASHDRTERGIGGVRPGWFSNRADADRREDPEADE
jgi:hypothetical protein